MLKKLEKPTWVEERDQFQVHKLNFVDIQLIVKASSHFIKPIVGIVNLRKSLKMI